MARRRVASLTALTSGLCFLAAVALGAVTLVRERRLRGTEAPVPG